MNPGVREPMPPEVEAAGQRLEADRLRAARAAGYPPGSGVATLHGCLCPVYDNLKGIGRSGPEGQVVYVIHGDCPLHGEKA